MVATAQASDPATAEKPPTLELDERQLRTALLFYDRFALARQLALGLGIDPLKGPGEDGGKMREQITRRLSKG